MSAKLANFIRSNMELAETPLVPEIKLYTAREVSSEWLGGDKWRHEVKEPPPFWKFAWPGGQALARLILDRPELVAGRRVLDFGAGGGIAAIAAAKSGAAYVLASDTDENARVALQLNASRNGVVIENCRKQNPKVDMIIAGDVCYEQAMSIRVLRWLRAMAAAGTQVLLADSGRGYSPDVSDLKEIAAYDVPVKRELEDCDVRRVAVWRF
ncbi:MAG: 50S ribosomal protein L11 methyltransferase [Alphaproteobacteria bacterium]|nr:50S ribosomal protein L11 methyltransferase [Alphaproteobacteria bacterium]